MKPALRMITLLFFAFTCLAVASETCAQTPSPGADGAPIPGAEESGAGVTPGSRTEAQADGTDGVPAPTPARAPARAPTPYYPQPVPDAQPEGYLLEARPNVPASGIEDRPGHHLGPGAREHEGFFLRFTLGGGVGFTRYREFVDQDVQTVKTGGLAGQFEVAIGGRLVENLNLHANLLVSGVGDADKTVSDVKDASSEIETDLAMLGVGVTYYFMPHNVYVSAMFGVGRTNETRDTQLAFRSGTGVGGSLMLGKEWWVGQRAEWGVGAALRGALLSAPVGLAGVESRLIGSQMTMAFSTTFN